MKKLKVFLTGGRGFVGKNICEQLGKTYDICAPTRNELDLLDTKKVSSFFARHRFDRVIHTAVVGGSRKEEEVVDSVAENLRMFFNIVKNRNFFGKFIYLSSGAVYDKSRPLVHIKEDAFGAYIPKDDYGFFKYICSKYLEHDQKNTVELRIFGLFGKYEDYRYRFISNVLCQNLLGLPMSINQDVVFDYMFIDDFLDIVDHFLRFDTKECVYNIGSNTPIHIVSIARMINGIADKKSDIVVQQKGLHHAYTCDATRLLKELPDKQFISMEKALQYLYQWYKKRIHHIDL